MSMRVSRRRFLGGVAATGTAAMLPARSQAAMKRQDAGSGEVSPSEAAQGEVAVRDLTHPSAGKVAWKVEPFSMTEVRLLPSFWKDTMEMNRSYLYSLPNDRLAYNFRVTAELPTDAAPLGGWEAPDCELRGHYVGHYMSSCALTHASTGDKFIADKANELVAMLAACQAKDGYLGAYPVEFYQRLREHKKVWAPFYTYHKILAGLIDMHEHCGNAQALEVAERMADWADTYARSFTDDDWQRVLLVEQGGMNEAMFNLYAITGKTKYRDLGFRFEHKKIFDPLAANEDKLGGNHANTNIPKVIGAARGYEMTGDERYHAISENFYRMVTDHHAYCTGGTSNGEFWHAPDAIASQLGPAAEECCCSYNMMKLARHLYGQNPDPRFFDYYERLLYNVRYGTQDPRGMLMYYVSLHPGLYKTFGDPLSSFWCCTGTGCEEYSKLNNSIYFHDDHTLYVNLYLPSKLDWKQRGFQLSQTSKFPEEGRVTFTVDRAPSSATTVKMRIPYWATGASVSINGEPQSLTATPSSYVTLDRAWKTGDVITIDLPLSLHLNTTPDDKQVQAAMYGPLVLAVLLGTDGLETSMIYGDSGPFDRESDYPMPTVNEPMLFHHHGHEGAAAAAQPPSDGVWLERVEGTRRQPLQFRARGRGVYHKLVPLNQIMDERYSVYVRNAGITQVPA